jgi:hypothetical protein
MNYEWKPLYRGYTDKILYVNVGSNDIKEKAVPPQVKEKFIGGKGYGLRLLWDATTPTTHGTIPKTRSSSALDRWWYYAVLRYRKIAAGKHIATNQLRNGL